MESTVKYGAFSDSVHSLRKYLRNSGGVSYLLSLTTMFLLLSPTHFFHSLSKNENSQFLMNKVK